jgi:hypothetical protein
MSIKNKVIIIILVFAALIVAGFYFGYQKYFLQKTERTSELIVEKPAETTKPESKKPPVPIPPAVPTMLSGYELYKNSEFGFQIQYPETWNIAIENIENVRGEQTKGFFFKKPNSDLRFAILPRDGLSYGLPDGGITAKIVISGSAGSQTQYTLTDGRRLLLVHPQYALFNWSEDIGRLDVMSSIEDPAGDFKIFNQMLQTFKFITQQ